MSTTRTSDCRKFSPNIFNKSKCSHCFRQREEHSAAALECNRASRKISKCGYLFVAPDWDFSNPLYRTKRWQRRWFILYDDGELTYSVDDHPETIPQACIDMTKVLEVATAEDVTGHSNSIAITAPDRVTFVKGTCPEESKWWLNILAAFPKSKGRHKRNATFPGGQATTILQSNSDANGTGPMRNRHNSYHKEALTSAQSTSLLIGSGPMTGEHHQRVGVANDADDDDDEEDDGVETGEDEDDNEDDEDDDDDDEEDEENVGESKSKTTTSKGGQDENNRNAGNEITNKGLKSTSTFGKSLKTTTTTTPTTRSAKVTDTATAPATATATNANATFTTTPSSSASSSASHKCNEQIRRPIFKTATTILLKNHFDGNGNNTNTNNNNNNNNYDNNHVNKQLKDVKGLVAAAEGEEVERTQHENREDKCDLYVPTTKPVEQPKNFSANNLNNTTTRTTTHTNTNNNHNDHRDHVNLVSKCRRTIDDQSADRAKNSHIAGLNLILSRQSKTPPQPLTHNGEAYTANRPPTSATSAAAATATPMKRPIRARSEGPSFERGNLKIAERSAINLTSFSDVISKTAFATPKLTTAATTTTTTTITNDRQPNKNRKMSKLAGGGDDVDDDRRQQQQQRQQNDHRNMLPMMSTEKATTSITATTTRMNNLNSSCSRNTKRLCSPPPLNGRDVEHLKSQTKTRSRSTAAAPTTTTTLTPKSRTSAMKRFELEI